ncbi:MAG TPA: O-acetyl-ADP-ribose deacetylase [Syntrophales bacterium]|jgi:O-acetyl-ADP-ribose deacetylase (regulator of RNase III)|nr:O-acetyl-ADP-ribose deacetylase [Syntrophales bacterium]HON24107.1 O-acetyl-ADP-ribose deacetylase [Syntrophales bacterium]HOU77355.1 O-acetyl-ADP-ribose deacetylase [Syntrophales bacterium]HPC32642.1 O-acetyl-ADP-ribose deacetylase [Syntrophales bacterium]HQG33956.1 O-acetyl-ADP-ribose deacetylase [Syntrophales bacterium]
MDVPINRGILSLVQGDITREDTEAIVNAANSRLAGGAGVDGAIHSAGGPSIMEECRRIGGCPTGQAVITTGGKLKAKYVIHTVGPVYRGGTRGEADLLRSAYAESLKLAAARKLKSVAFPAISTGVYGYPLGEAAHIALKTAVDYLRGHEDIELIRFVLFDRGTYDVFVTELKKII